jgi:hypothetical protein
MAGLVPAISLGDSRLARISAVTGTSPVTTGAY